MPGPKQKSAHARSDVSIQYGALPYRCRTSGGIEVLLITSRETARWVIPKGWPMRGRSPAETACVEAYEEAGIKGVVSEGPVGSYRYVKWTPTRLLLCEVTVFPLLVERELEHWPEDHERNCLWASSEDAAALVDEPDLAEIIRKAGSGFAG